MLRRALIGLLLLQLADLAALVWMGRRIGIVETIVLTTVTGMIGSVLARREGLRVWRGWNASLSAGRAPEDGMISGMLVLLAGLLLVAPGLGTDVIGLVLLLPFTRRRIAGALARRVQTHLERRARATSAEPLGVSSGLPNGRGGVVIDTTGVESLEHDTLERPDAQGPRALPE